MRPTPAKLAEAVQKHGGSVAASSPDVEHFELEVALEALMEEEYENSLGGAAAYHADVAMPEQAAHSPAPSYVSHLRVWLASLVVSNSFHKFVKSDNTCTRFDMHPSLLLVSAAGPHEDHPVRALEIVVWDDVSTSVGRRTRIEDPYLTFVPKPQRTQGAFVDYAGGITSGAVQILLANMGVRMIRRIHESSAERPSDRSGLSACVFATVRKSMRAGHNLSLSQGAGRAGPHRTLSTLGSKLHTPPTPTTKPSGKGGGRRPPLFPMGFAAGGGNSGRW